MGKGDKGKKGNGKNANSKKMPVAPPMPSKSKENSRINYSQNVVCQYCGVESEESAWFVQCDDCDGYVHFQCAGVVDVKEEDPWSCQYCKPGASHTEAQSTQLTTTATVHRQNNEQADSMRNKNPAVVRGQDEIEVVDQSLQSTISQTQHIASSTVTRHQISSNARSSVSQLTTSSMRRRKEIEIRRLEEELAIQNELDEQTLALNLEAVKMKALRKKQFLAEKYRMLDETNGSVVSKGGSVHQSTLASEWIEKQRNENAPHKSKSMDDMHLRGIQRFSTRLDEVGFDVSIPIEEHEVAIVQSANLEKVNKRKEFAEKQMQQFMAWYKAQNEVKNLPQRVVMHSNQTQENIDASVPTTEPCVQASEPVSQVACSSDTQSPNDQEPRRIELQTSANNPGHQVVQRPGNQLPKGFPIRQEIQPSALNPIKNAEQQKNCNSQQQTVSQQTVSHQSSQSFTQPSSRSTLLSSGTSTTQPARIELSGRHTIPTNTFPATNQQAVNSGQISYGIGHTSLNYENLVSSRPIMSTMTNAGNFTSQYRSFASNVGSRQNRIYFTSEGNHTSSASTMNNVVTIENTRSSIVSSANNSEYYDHIYSFPSSGQHNVSSSLGTRDEINYAVPAIMRAALTPSQIAARHAIPKELPRFSGHPKDWCRFFMRYVSSTNMCGYADHENLERLDKCLQHPARTLVESLLLMPNSVPEILDTLREKYGRPELVIKYILKEIRSYPVIKSDKLEKLSDYGYAVRNACNQIEVLGLHVYMVNPELIQEVVDKMPYQTKIDWARHSNGLPLVTLRTISDWLHDLSRTINRITSPEFPSNDKDDSKSGDTDNSNNESSKKGYVYVHDKNESQLDVGNEKCLICTSNCIDLEHCTKFKNMDVNQRWDALKSNNLCRKCLKQHKRNCDTTKECGVNGCQFKHHSLLHNQQRISAGTQKKSSGDTKTTENKRNDGKSTEVQQNELVKVTSGSNNTHHVADQEMFRIVPVFLYNKDHSVQTFAYLDEGSSFTLIERKMTDQLELSGIPENICLLWTKNIHRQENSESVKLEIAGDFSDDNKETALRYTLNGVNVVDELNLPEQSLPVNQLKARYQHLRNIPIKGYEQVIPTILIGIKHAKLAVPLKTVEGNDDEPIATKSRLGWSIYGPVKNSSTGYVNSHRVARCPCQDRDDEMHKMIKDHFTVENFGVVANSINLDSKENEKATKMLEELTVRKGNRFETGLLWKNEVYQLPDSYGMAKRRLECLERKGSKTINVINEAIRDYVNKGYVHKLSPTELTKSHKRIWYLPLFTVANPKKPDKLRTVFDAAAKVRGVSLNSVLHNGPDLVPSIVDILRRFRENEIAIAGDIKEMYHQVLVNEEDRHAQRFLWRDGESDREPDVYTTDVLTFGSRSSPCSAQFVKNKNAAEFEKDYPRAAIAIKKNTYVDDLMDGEKTIQQAIKLIHDVKFVHRQGGFEIRNFKSNSTIVLKAIGEPAVEEKMLVDDGANIERVLGMFWDTTTDSFTFSLRYTKVTADVLEKKRLPTKRELLKLLMSIFDPLGLLSYYLTHLKILLQHVWKSKCNWDETLPQELKPMWDQWIEHLPSVEKLKIPRWYFSGKSIEKENIELHIFVDAGEHAYAAVSYVRFETEDESNFKCSLVGSKSRVAPLKYMSTPRLELMAALLGTRLANSIREALASKIYRRVIWSDSRTVLTWLHSEHQRYSQFVGHRVGEILETSELTEWRWIPRKFNVADRATKWLNNPTFSHTDVWFTGPTFLQGPESEWPKQPDSIVPNGTTEEMKMSCAHAGLILPAIVNPENFSKWERAVKAVAFAIRWGKKVLAKVRKSPYTMEPLTQEELKLAESFLFRQAQWQELTEEMITLTRNQRQPKKLGEIKKNSPIYNCSPYLDEFGVLRDESRNVNAKSLSIAAKRPIILPRNHRLTKLLMLSYHRKYLHRNHETAINELRQRFYVPRIRVAYNSARWSCKLCEVKRERPKVPKMAALPAFRFETHIRPFTYTGVDYFGPMKVMIGRRREKRWGALFTCLTIRAIHIELAASLDTGTCIKLVRNFINWRGAPAEFHSDNGTNFVGADNALKEELKKLNVMELSTSVTSCYTKWNFNPPASPHMGGCWERLIKTVKLCLEQSMTTRTPQEEDLRSLLIEAMNIVNSRPLTWIPVDSTEAEALTPNHFILGSSNGIKPPGKFTNDGPYLRDVWKEIQRCTNVFWNRFIREYAPTLTRRSKWLKMEEPIKVGDVVLDIDERYPRNTYPKARVVETIMGSGSQVRRARVQFANGNALWRPVSRLAKLDVFQPCVLDETKKDVKVTPTEQMSLESLATVETGGNIVGATNLNTDADTVSGNQIDQIDSTSM